MGNANGWTAFKTKKGTTGAKNAAGKRLYGKHAAKVLGVGKAKPPKKNKATVTVSSGGVTVKSNRPEHIEKAVNAVREFWKNVPPPGKYGQVTVRNSADKAGTIAAAYDNAAHLSDADHQAAHAAVDSASRPELVSALKGMGFRHPANASRAKLQDDAKKYITARRGSKQRSGLLGRPGQIPERNPVLPDQVAAQVPKKAVTKILTDQEKDQLQSETREILRRNIISEAGNRPKSASRTKEVALRNRKSDRALKVAVDAAHSQYEAIKKDLRSLSVDEMRSRFAAIADQPVLVLEGLVKQLGYAPGNRTQNVNTLLANLTDPHAAAKQLLADHVKGMKGKKGVFMIVSRDHTRKLPMPGTLHGHFAIHKPNGDMKAKGYQISHVHTGLKAGSANSYEDAKHFVALLAAKGNWDFKDKEGLDKETHRHGVDIGGMLKGGDYADAVKLAGIGEKPVAMPNEIATWEDKFRELQAKVKDLTIPQLRSEFTPFLALNKNVIDGVSKRFSLSGSKKSKTAELLDILEKMRLSYEDRRIIAGNALPKDLPAMTPTQVGQTKSIYDRAAKDDALEFGHIDDHVAALGKLPKVALIQHAKAVDVTSPASASKAAILKQISESIKGRKARKSRTSYF